MNEQARNEVIATLTEAAQAAQAALAQVSGFVIVWHDACLKVSADGNVRLFGEKIYSGKPSEMIAKAAEWNSKIGADEPRAVAMSAKAAAEKLAAAHAEMMAAIRK